MNDLICEFHLHQTVCIHTHTHKPVQRFSHDAFFLVPNVQLTSSMTLIELLNLPVPHIYHLYNGYENSTCFIGLL